MTTIADMLVRLKNAQARGLEGVSFPSSKLKLEVAKILMTKGFVESVEKKSKKGKNSKSEFPHLYLKLKYEDGVGVINGTKLISKPSRRIYVGKRALRPVKSGYGISVISTPNGLMTGDEARKKGVGGEFLFEIW